MSMYGLVFDEKGATDRGKLLLSVLGFTAFGDVGRYRDSWVEKAEGGELVIAVYTRNGGGNREECWHADEDLSPPTADTAACDCAACKANHFLPEHPLWRSGADDSFDSTYRAEYFSVPEEYREALSTIAQDHVDTGARWLAAIEAIKGGES